MTERYDRHLRFKSVTNFRDLGGYRTRSGKTVPWRRIFRSGEFARINPDDYRRLTEEIKLAAVVDLRSNFEVERQGTGLPAGSSIKYYNISFIADGGQTTDVEARRYKTFTNMGEFYLEIVKNKGFGGRIVQALEIIAEAKNHPLVFNCAIGKDRTGILAAMLLSTLGVAEKDIIEDYALSDQYMDALRRDLESHSNVPDDVKRLPDFFWRAAPESMTLLLTTLRRDYGSITDYLKTMGADKSLIKRLEKALLFG
jgi:protein-tyrosine phosphatase